ncbi:MAG: hypothetical protein WCI45_07370 [Desulfuromonadales bacterium]
MQTVWVAFFVGMILGGVIGIVAICMRVAPIRSSQGNKLYACREDFCSLNNGGMTTADSFQDEM